MVPQESTEYLVKPTQHFVFFSNPQDYMDLDKVSLTFHLTFVPCGDLPQHQLLLPTNQTNSFTTLLVSCCQLIIFPKTARVPIEPYKRQSPQVRILWYPKLITHNLCIS